MGFLTDISSLVDHMRVSGASDWYLSGFKRMESQHKEFMLEASIVSRVAESFQQELMEDSRLALRYTELIGVMSDELRWMCVLDGEVWRRLGFACGLSGEELASRCIAAAHISYHFIWRRVLQPAGEYPWALLDGGDIRANLEELRHQEEPAEPTTQKLWHLLHAPELGVGMDLLVDTVRMFGEAPWTSLPAEQQHGSLAVLHRWHPEYTLETLTTRSFILQLCRLMPSRSAGEKQLGEVMRRMRRILASDPARAGGRHEFFKHVFKMIHEKRSWTSICSETSTRAQAMGNGEAWCAMGR